LSRAVWLDAGELELVTKKEGYLGGILKLLNRKRIGIPPQ
jgi:hypothetical protein